MALMKRSSLPVRPWSSEARKTSVKLPQLEKPPSIDYDKLRQLCAIQGLRDVSQGVTETSEDAHWEFMSTYKDIFVKKPKKLGFPIHSELREQQKVSEQSVTQNATGKTTEGDKKKPKKLWPIDNITHDVRDYLPLLHKQRKIEDPKLIRQENLKTLRRLLRKLPFQRTVADNDKIFSILRTFQFFKEHIPDHVLKELCVVALHETWKDPDFTIFGNTGLHMVLHGTVAPITHPYLNTDNAASLRVPTPLVLNEPEDRLGTGECFGTLRRVEGREPSSKVYSVVTKDNNCEFLKIPATDYARVIDQIKQREHTEKVNLLLSCGQYKLWPRQPLLQVADLIEWITYPPNTVLVSEGYMAPYIGFIKSGECHILRQVEVMHALPNGKRHAVIICRSRLAWIGQAVQNLVWVYRMLGKHCRLKSGNSFYFIVLASEEYKAPYVALIKSGEATIMKMINVALHIPGGKKEKRTKQVVMGRLGSSDSFAELSVLLNEMITCSVVTATEMTLGVIRPDKIKDLDEVTIQLFKQSNNRTFGDLTKEDIQEEYVNQELKREWNEFKHGVLLDVINSRGIRPGYGKWSK